MVSVATCLNMNEGVKTAHRWCRGSKIQIIKNLLKIRKLLLHNSKFILINFFNKSIIFYFIFMCCQSTPTPNYQVTNEWKSKKVINMNLLFFNNNFFILRGLSQITFALRVGRWLEKRVVYYIKSAN